MLISSTLLFPYEFGKQFHLIQGSILSIFVLTLTLQNSISKSLKIPKDPFTIFIFLFFLLNLISAIWANNISLVWKKSSMWLVVFLFYINVRSLELSTFNQRFWKRLIIGILMINFGLILFSFYQFAFDDAGNFFFSNRQIQDSASFFSLNGNYITSLFVLLFPATLWMVDQSNWKRPFLIFLNGLLVFFILIYNSRASAIALISILAIYAFYYFKANKSLFRIFSSLSFVAVFVVSAYFLVDKPGDYFNQFNPFRTVLEKTKDDRPVLWKNSLKLFTEAPVLGVGSGNWIVEINRYGNNEYWANMTYGHAHNFLFETLGELGILGGTLLLFILLYPLFFIRKYGAKNNLLFYFALFFVGFFILNFFYGIIYLSFKLMLLWAFVVAWLFSFGEAEKYKFALFPFLLLGAILIAAYAYIFYFDYANYRFKSRSNNRSNVVEVIDHLYLPNVHEFNYSNHLLFTKANYLPRNERDFAIDLLEYTLDKNPYSWNTHYALGKKYFEKRNFDKSLKNYKQALVINDEHIPSFLGIGRISTREKYWDEFDMVASIFENELIPFKEKKYLSDDLLNSNFRPEKLFWNRRCNFIDQYYNIAYRRFELMKEKKKTK